MAAEVVGAWGAPVLRVVGVLDGLAVLRAADVALDAPPEPALEDALDGVGDWLDELGAVAADAFGSALGATAGEVSAIRDLDLVLDDAWPELLALLAATPELRAALLTPVRLAGPAGGSVPAPSYAAWWLREQLADGGAWADPEAPAALAALLPPAPPALAGADPAVRAALGGVRSASELDAQAVQGVLAGLADPEVDIDVATALRIWAALAELAGTVEAVPPDRVRVLAAVRTELVGTEVVDADRASVAGDPMVLQRGDLGPFVVVPGASAARDLADLLDLPLAADLARGVVDESGAGSPTSRRLRPRSSGAVPGGGASTTSCWSTAPRSTGGSTPPAWCTRTRSTGSPAAWPMPPARGSCGRRWRRCWSTRRGCPPCSVDQLFGQALGRRDM